MLLNQKQPRIEPVGLPYDEATAAALADLGRPIALFRVLARRPERADAIATWGRYYRSRRVALTLRQRELVLIAGWYHAISFAVRALRFAQEPGAPRLAG